MSGKIPSEQDLLIIKDRGPIRCLLNYFSILVGRLKGPHDLKLPNSEIISSISLEVQGWRKNTILDFITKIGSEAFLASRDFGFNRGANVNKEVVYGIRNAFIVSDWFINIIMNNFPYIDTRFFRNINQVTNTFPGLS